jgi:hypothetical protein
MAAMKGGENTVFGKRKKQNVRHERRSQYMLQSMSLLNFKCSNWICGIS